jgi:hypothetical protein
MVLVPITPIQLSKVKDLNANNDIVRNIKLGLQSVKVAQTIHQLAMKHATLKMHLNNHINITRTTWHIPSYIYSFGYDKALHVMCHFIFVLCILKG